MLYLDLSHHQAISLCHPSLIFSRVSIVIICQFSILQTFSAFSLSSIPVNTSNLSAVFFQYLSSPFNLLPISSFSLPKSFNSFNLYYFHTSNPFHPSSYHFSSGSAISTPLLVYPPLVCIVCGSERISAFR